MPHKLLCLACFFVGALFIFSAIGFWFAGAKALWMIVATGAWVKTPCTVRSSELELRYQGPDSSDSYRIKVSFTYEFGGRKFWSDTYDFTNGGGSSASGWKQDVVRELPS